MIDHRPPSPLRGFCYYLRNKMLGRPMLVNLELTKRCNARCGFCPAWQLESKDELADYAPVIKKFRPVVVSISGGEPLVRKGYADLLRGLRPWCHYLVLITNGALLNRESALALVGAGVDQICVSLDFLGSRHDEMRRLDGLYGHLEKTIPALTAEGVRVVLNTVIMESNLGEILPITYRAKEWGAAISYSAYCALKRDDDGGMVAADRYTQLAGIIDEILHLKRTMGHIKSSDYYLKRIPRYFRDGRIGGCKAGYRWLQVTPDGYIQQCSELPRLCHYTEFDRARLTRPACAKCWYSCRGEAQAPPLAPRRLLELIRA